MIIYRLSGCEHNADILEALIQTTVAKISNNSALISEEKEQKSEVEVEFDSLSELLKLATKEP